MNSSKIKLPPNVSIEKVPREDDDASTPSTSRHTSLSPQSSSSKSSVLGDTLNSKYSQNRNIHSKLDILSEINISLDELRIIGTRQLNLLLKNVSKEKAAEIKNVRRTLKNRNYASCSRERTLEEKMKMKKEIKCMKERVKEIDDKINMCRNAIDNLIKECDQLFHSLDAYEDSEELKAEVKEAVLKECTFSDKELESTFLSLGLNSPTAGP